MKLIKIKSLKKMEFALKKFSNFLIVKPYINKLNLLHKNNNYFFFNFPLKQFKIFFKNEKILNCFNGKLMIIFFKTLNIFFEFLKKYQKNINNILPLVFFYQTRYFNLNYINKFSFKKKEIILFDLIFYLKKKNHIFFFKLQNFIILNKLVKLKFLLQK